jgi:hypothetical protein
MIIKLLSSMLLVVVSICLLGCDEETYVIHCLPLDADFYVPPDREYIIKHGKMVEMKSPETTSLYGSLQKMKSSKVTTEDLGRLRVLIVRKTDKAEFYITSEKKIIVSDKKYEVDEKIVDDLLARVGCR